jgi:transposase
MNELTTDHYKMLLGLNDCWSVDSVVFEPDQKRVTVKISFCGSELCCPDCDALSPQADMAPERKWRHLDTMQFATEIHARIPRSKCSKCGVKTIKIPWAGKHSRFTLLFEAFAIEVMQACSNVKRAAELLGIDWSTAHAIMKRAVDRGLKKRSIEKVHNVGVDEKSFGSGQDYVSIMTDLDGSRVLEVVEERTNESADKLWESLPETQRKQVRAVAMDMWGPFINSARKHVPEAEIVHDKFHIAKYLNDAVDKVRRRENRELRESEDMRLTGTRQLWLYAKPNLSRKRLKELKALQDDDLKTAKAWSMKENFRHFWRYVYSTSAEGFFETWYDWVIESGITPMIKVAEMLERHLPEILSYFRHRITNATSEGYNSKIQSIKSAARGFRAFENYRTRILFYCGKLSLKPNLSH